MPDREKVIKGLEQFISDFKPYCGNKADWGRVFDALALLKAQEPVTPCRDTFLNWRCGYCKTEIDRYEGHKYCPNCGKKVRWE